MRTMAIVALLPTLLSGPAHGAECGGLTAIQHAPLMQAPSVGARRAAFGLHLHPVLGIVKLHAGLDFEAPIGDPVMAAAAGKIVLVATNVTSSTVTGLSVARPMTRNAIAMRWSMWVATVPPPRTDLRARDDQRVAIDLRRDTIRRQRRRGRRQSIAFLDLQFAEPVHARLARGERRDNREDRIFVDHARCAIGGNVDALQGRIANADIGDRLAAFLALVLEGDVAAHLFQRGVEAGACLVDEHALDRHVGAGHDRSGGSEERGRRGIARHGDVTAGQLGIALDGDDRLAVADDGFHIGAEVAQHPLGVIARRLLLDDGRLAGCGQTREQDGGLDLGARHRRGVFDRHAGSTCRAASAATSRDLPRRRGPSASAASAPASSVASTTMRHRPDVR